MIKYKKKKCWSRQRIVLLLVLCCLFLPTNAIKAGEKDLQHEVTVAMVDTGVDLSLIPKERLSEFTYNCIDGSGDVTDAFGHGTEIASLIAANTAETVKIMPIKAADADGKASIEGICTGLRQAASHGADIINLSLNTYFYNDDNELERIINELTAQGISVVVSAGNQADTTDNLCPANVKSAIVVGAVDENREQYYFSNYGDTVDFYAYGKYNGQLGTSFSAAYVTAMIADRMQCGIKNVEEKLISDAESGNVLWDPDLNTGKEETESTLYVGETEKTPHDIGAELLNLDWKNLDAEELDQYLGETAPEYVGLFLNMLTVPEKGLLDQKSKIVHTDVFVGSYQENKENYELASSEEVPFTEYCMQRYREKKNVFSVSDYLCKSTEAIFYISSPDRNIIYRYVITGLYDKYGVDREDGVGTFQYSDLNIAVTLYKNNGLSYNGTFTCPIPISLSRYTNGVRARKTEFYLYDDTYMGASYDNDTPEEWNDGMRTYGISIRFNNYTNTRAGYRSDPNAVKMYNAGYGIGTTTSPAMSYQNEYGWSMPQTSNFTFNTLYNGYIRYECKYGRLRRDDIYFTAAPTTLNDSTGTFSLNIAPFLSMGTRWYNGNNLASSSDIPEIVFALSQNSYTMKTNHYKWNPNTNQWVFWKTTTASAAYGAKYLPTYATPPAGYHKDVIEWENGWTVSGDATFSAYYKPNTYTMKTNHYKWNPNTDQWVFWKTTTASAIYGTTYTPAYVTPPLGYHKDAIEWENGWTVSGDATFSAYYKPNTYSIAFDGSGGEGNMEQVTATYDKPLTLPENEYVKGNDFGSSVFLGWGMAADTREVLYPDAAEVKNLTKEENATVTLYAVWDDCPWIIAEDLYYTLGQAQSGFISREELMSHASAEDREDGIIAPGENAVGENAETNTVAGEEPLTGEEPLAEEEPGTELSTAEDEVEAAIDENAGKWTSFEIIDYQESDFTQFQHEGSVTETYQVRDSIGNTFKKTITVYVVDTTAVETEPEGTTRFINEKYFNETYENGGLEDNSIWKTDPEYRAVLQSAFNNAKNDIPEQSYVFTYDEILQMQKFIEDNGIGNSKSKDVLQRFCEQFVMPNRIK